jgi:hypothetical protein
MISWRTIIVAGFVASVGVGIFGYLTAGPDRALSYFMEFAAGFFVIAAVLLLLKIGVDKFDEWRKRR